MNYRFLGIGLISMFFTACVPELNTLGENKQVPPRFFESTDTASVGDIQWRDYFSDPNLNKIIDSALLRNQELNLLLQEIQIAKTEIRERKGEYLPSLGLGAGADLEKVGEFTRNGAVEHNLPIEGDKAFPEPLSNYSFAAIASWEIDVWKKMRNAKKAAVSRYLASIEGKNFMQTNLVAEIADSYYELVALDNLLDIIQQNIAIQADALKIAQQQKQSAKVTQLAVNRFEAQLLNTQNLQFTVQQRIIEAENRIRFLCGNYNAPIERSKMALSATNQKNISPGVPTQLLRRRPDVRQAEQNLIAAKLDVKSARANFYPGLDIKAGLGFQNFNPEHLISPEALTYNIAGEIMAPLLNRNAIKAQYQAAGSRQIQAVIRYEQSLLNAYVDVLNELSKWENYSSSYETKAKEVALFTESIQIANSLFNSARADYAEVLFTQREALESKMELIEIQLEQTHAKVNLYRALGGGWQ